MKRKDVHKPSDVNPSDYVFLFSFSYPGLNGGAPYNLGLLNAVQRGEPTYRVAEYGVVNGAVVITGYHEQRNTIGHLPHAKVEHNGGCDVCGANFVHGAAFKHAPTGELVILGHVCANKMGLHERRGDWLAHQRQMAGLRKTAEYQRLRMEREASRAAEGAAFLIAHPGLTEALSTNHHITKDLSAKLARYGSLSEAQIALAFKLQCEVTEEKVAPATKLTPPAGRVVVEGAAVSVKEVETDFGTATKMLVEVIVNGGSYRVFGTVPAAIMDALRRECQTLDYSTTSAAQLRGRRVRFTATLQPKEPGFGFFSRPSKAELLPKEN